MKILSCGILLAISMSATAYPIDVQKKLNGLDIDFNEYDTASDMASIRINNYGTVDAACKVTFRHGPDLPKTKHIQVAAKSHKIATAKFTRAIINMHIQLTCEPR